MRVPDELLAVKASHHAVLEGLFVAQKLTQDCTELQVVLTKVPEFE